VAAASGQQKRWQGCSSDSEAVAVASSGQGQQCLDGGGRVGVAAAMAAVARGDGRWHSVRNPGKTLGKHHVSVPVTGIKCRTVATSDVQATVTPSNVHTYITKNINL
jgi:hypothetical protein